MMGQQAGRTVLCENLDPNQTSMKNLVLTSIVFFCLALAGQAQKTACDAPIPSMAEMADVAVAIENFTPPSPAMHHLPGRFLSG